MNTLLPLTSFEQIKLLSDPRRLQILRLLMAQPATLSQIGRALDKHPAWVQHHIRTLERAGLVEVAEVRANPGLVEKFYRAKASGFIVQQTILPHTDQLTLLFSGSHDLALELLGQQLSARIKLLVQPVGSLNGLAHLRIGLCQFSGIHLRNEEGEYNVPFVRKMFADQAVRVVTLAHRTQGWMTAPGNPYNIQTVTDLLQPGVRFVYRNRGSGTQLWLANELQRAGVSATSPLGNEQTVFTHTEAAALIARGQADAALGLEAAAWQLGLGFVPLFQERYDLVIPEEQITTLTPVLDALHSAAFRQAGRNLAGYEFNHTGKEWAHSLQ
ncbi:MAG: hypothetical protein DDG60_15150 [Anaerolineae bacterium]|nr:MAG: hypothetical protein DDG60_15150 [Anaerolineae bacterium]